MKKKSSSASNIIASLFKTLFGSITWKSPQWLVFLGNKAKLAPFKFWSSIGGVLILILAGSYAVYWYKNLPKPLYVTASITIPDTTPNDETLVPNNLVIQFGIENNGFTPQSVAPLQKIGKTIDKGIEIEPKIKGAWTWSSDNQLVFTPSEDWPSDQKFTIHVDKDFFATQAIMNSYSYSFTTKPFNASISNFTFYQDPVEPEIRYAVATIEFNYPVNTLSLEKNTSLAFEALKNEKINLKKEPLKFWYTYDVNKRIAYLHSENIHILDVARFVHLNLDKKIESSTGSELEVNQDDNLFIPDSSNFLKVESSSASIIRNDKDRPEQVLTIETSLGVNESEFNKSVHMYLLPKDYPATRLEPAKPNYSWENPGEVTQTIQALLEPLSYDAIPLEQNYSRLHSFRLNTQTPRYIYLKIDKGMRGFGGFKLNHSYAAIIPVPEYPKEISFLHKGSLLALGGEKKLSVLVRGVPAVQFQFARVMPENINQLVTQTQGDFNNPYFINPSFNQQNISTIFSEIQRFDSNDPSKQQYTALDFEKYLQSENNIQGPQGLFLLQATAWDPVHNYALDVKASRLILITDLGLLVKDNNDGSHDVFVSSITQGTPVAGATITLLGKNGLPLLTRITDAQGRADFPSVKDFIDEKEPTVYVAGINNDVSFIPFNNYNRQLNFSKFDIGGLYTNSQDQNNLSAYLFSDRGIYRPGDSVHIGMIVKQNYALSQPSGLPLQAIIQDPRGTTIKDQKILLNDLGFMDLDFATQNTSPTGQYTVNLYLVKDDHPQNLLGSTTVDVQEFQPDRMKISTHLLPKPMDGWTNPMGLKASVDLWNLYGAPAPHRRVSAKILLTPQTVSFSKYPDYVFADPLFDPKKPPKVFTDTLTDATTNDNGEVEFPLNLEKYEKATYQLTFFAEGFESEGGRSVTTQTKALISPLPYFVGYKTDGDLRFIKQNGQRTIHFIAINPQLGQEEIKDLKIQLLSSHPVTTLVKKPDGTYQYQSIIQSSVLNTSPFTIDRDGTSYQIPTQDIGDYEVRIIDKDETPLSQLKYSIVGASHKPLAQNAQLSIKLDKEEYKAGEDIQLQITAPYTGSGLITIERDKVYASAWFKTESTSSLQTIHLPADFQGNGYVNVAYIRDWNSPELFISPLSYSVVPFEVSPENHDLHISLTVPEVSKPGQDYKIKYHTDKPGKIIVFAIDEGILQVARYETPDPLGFFFQKHALEVFTQQTVDQILPKFIQDRELSAVGGDNGESELAGKLNPFKRKTDLPVVFWSGIIDTDSTEKELSYPIPDYFNGTLRVMAVAVGSDSVGSAETSSQIRGDFVISPNIPTFVAPGDEFEISASIANNIKDSGDHKNITIGLGLSEGLEPISEAIKTLEIPEGAEQSVEFKVRAKSKLGDAKLTLTAMSEDKSSAIDTHLSVRPASPLSTYIGTGIIKDPKKTLKIMQNFYSEHRDVQSTMSTSPLILVYGLQRYLDNFPYGCTEQLTSKAMPLLAMNTQSWFNKDSTEISTKIYDTIHMLSQRQMSTGAFSYWPGFGDNYTNSFVSVYAMQFLTQARSQGFVVPTDMFYNGINYLKELASQTPTDLNEARIQAYAIYILTTNELVTSNYITHLELFLQQKLSNTWKKDITAVYLAASYQMLKSFDAANALINQFHIPKVMEYSDGFYDRSVVEAQYLYIIAKHFPDKLSQVDNAVLMQIINSINSNQMNTIFSGYASLALSVYQAPQAFGKPTDLSVTKTLTNKQSITIPSKTPGYQKEEIESNVAEVTFNNPTKQTLFYQLMQSGFDNSPTKTPIKKGIEIYREYTNKDGSPISYTNLGNEIEVHIHIRALDNKFYSNIAIEDLLPGGFEVVRDSVKTNYMDYADIREDRVNFFGSIDSNAKEIVYTIKATNIGTYTIPPTYAQAMYDPMIMARGVTGEIKVYPNS